MPAMRPETEDRNRKDLEQLLGGSPFPVPRFPLGFERGTEGVDECRPLFKNGNSFHRFSAASDEGGICQLRAFWLAVSSCDEFYGTGFCSDRAHRDQPICQCTPIVLHWVQAWRDSMSKTSTVRARIQPKLKARAEKVFHRLGLNATQAITLFYRQVELREGLPFEVAIPTRTTKRTFESTDAGRDLIVCDNLDEMFEKLGI